MGGVRRNRCEKDRAILRGKGQGRPKEDVPLVKPFWRCGLTDRHRLHELFEAGQFSFRVLVFLGKVLLRLLVSILGRDELLVRQLPKANQPTSLGIGGGEENIGIQEEDVQALSPLRFLVPYGLRIKTECADFRHSPRVVLGIDCVIEQKLSLAFLGIDLHGERRGRSNEDSLLHRFRDYQRTFFDAILSAQVGRDNQRTAFSHPACFNGVHALPLSPL
jgi:hypothetical protein